MQRRFGDNHGGLIWHVAPDGRVLDDHRSQNPLMHTFEALIVLAPLDESGNVRRDAARIWPFPHLPHGDVGALPSGSTPSGNRSAPASGVSSRSAMLRVGMAALRSPIALPHR